MERFGFSDITYVLPPKYDGPLSVVNDPLFQEWTDFRCQQLANYYEEMAAFIRGLNPEVAVECNPHSGLSGENEIYQQGVDYPRLLASMDAVWSEEGNEASVTAEGVLVSKIRTYKMASILHNKIFTYTSSQPLQMAEAMTYNRQCLGHVEGGKMMVHLLNYDSDRNPLVTNIEVNLKLPEGWETRRVSLLSPEEEGQLQLQFIIKNHRVIFTVPRLKTYDLIVVHGR